MKLFQKFYSLFFILCTMPGSAQFIVDQSSGKNQVQIPLEDFFRNPEKNQYQISPDGLHLSYLAPVNSRMNLFVRETEQQNAKQLTSITDRDISGYMWANNNTILFLKDNGGDENFVLYSIDISSGKTKTLTPETGVRCEFIDPLEEDDAHVLISLNKRDARFFDPYRLDVNTGKLVQIAENPGNISSWLCDHEGKLRAATTTDGVNTSLIYRASETSDWETLVTTNFKESLSPLFFTFDNKNLYCSSNIGRDKSAIVLYDVAQRKETEVLFEHGDVDVYEMTYSRIRKVLTTIRYTVDRVERHFLDAQTETWFRDLESKLPGKQISISSSTRDENKLVVRTYSDRSLGAYYLYDIPTHVLTLIENVSPWLQEDMLCSMEPFAFKTEDGLVIHGYMTYPHTTTDGPLPVVVNPHGGPWARDDWGYNPEVQFLANRGYLVIQLNFRGSTGYGKRFWVSGFKQWGKTMQQDITEAVQMFLDKGIADPKRIAIYGGSYGGYATLAGLAFTPKLYACGIDYVGVSNLFTFMNTIPPYWEPYLAMMHEMVGDPVADKELLEAASPVFHADQIVAPVLIAQGAKDPRVNKEESDQMVRALKARGIDVEYIVEPEEGHGFRNEENRFRFYRAMEQFLAEHLKQSKY